jgi:hypothetical protein
MFDRHAFVDLFSLTGLFDIDQQTQRVFQFSHGEGIVEHGVSSDHAYRPMTMAALT